VRGLAILLACASLAACGGDPGEPQENQVQAATEPEAAAAVPGNAMPPPTEVDNAQPTAPDPAPVPAAFRGTWAESEALCADRSHPSRLVISAATLRFHESVLGVARVDRIGPREINIIGTATGEGTTRPAESHYSIDAAGETLTDEAGGGMVRRRCAS
jgi:hypothetical protein